MDIIKGEKKRYSNTPNKKMIRKYNQNAIRYSTPRRYLVVMLKVPVAGRVKTRLARDIGIIPATNFYRQTLQILIRRLGNSRIWTTILATTPDREYKNQILPHNLTRIPQGTGNLGKRFQRIFDTLAPNPILIVGSDIPSIRKEDIAEAFHRLAGKKAIVGPSVDGGFWLIGLRRNPRVSNIFESIPWSSQKALIITLEKLSGLSLEIFKSLQDVDTQIDYESQKPIIGREIISPLMREAKLC